ncbi:hypothetical protein FDB72_10400 [Clostridium botulinum]|uniref:DUF7210 family protein n=1 Tax=Clostridium botulinum TaxID=1491 RepID=UPI00059E0409|nr:hypothetical protein [Clostridium botulinum]KIN80210.1 hypothetical protein SD74_16865 [Clostridium botulinum]MCC5426020.1 hypothetical protein [Clostridium botulinum]NFM46539.1 hypothetical protein [Clostridium botulinum]PSM00366.1 hypothetical protein C6C12_11550 [Clostridium botulinum]HDK7138935.1 hypothetical protein [Clostridium botulinum]
MAKSKEENIYVMEDEKVEEKIFKAKAKQYIKYAGTHIKIDEEFQVKECDLEELRKYAEIEEGE